MKILIIGYSNLFKNRIIPILYRFPIIKEVHVAKFEEQKWDDCIDNINERYKVVKYNNYDDAFKSADVDLTYVSSVNSDHFKSAKASLSRGLHTIIDKPATLNLSELNTLLKISRSKNLLLAESTVYLYHPQFEEMKNIFCEKYSHINAINAIFSFPLLKNNFRYKKELGGGAINDTGSYVASLARYFFNEIPKSIYCSKIMDEEKSGLELAYTILMEFSKNRNLMGHFGFLTEYVNQINLLGPHLFISADRVFTIPEDKSQKLKVRADDKEYSVEIVARNNFLIFFKEIFSALENKDYEKFRKDMYMDGLILDKIRKSARDKNYRNFLFYNK
jgi:NDP-hexose-3-ketoreductase